MAGVTVASGSVVVAIGPLGQRDSSGTASTGYRVQATRAGELEVIPPPSPTPNPTPTPTPIDTATPSPTTRPRLRLRPRRSTSVPTATPTQAPTPSPSPTGSASTLGAVRAMPIGSKVRTTGVVVAEAGRLGTPALLLIGSADAGLVVHLPPDAPTLARGALLEVSGKLAAPYGQLEIRPGKSDLRVIGTLALPAAIAIPSGGLGESLEGRLATGSGRVTAKPKRAAGGDITIILERDGATPIKVMADPSSRIELASFKVGATYRVVGVAGQRASRSGALDGYRLWLRDPADLGVVAAPAPSASSSPSPKGSAGCGRGRLDRTRAEDQGP